MEHLAASALAAYKRLLYLQAEGFSEEEAMEVLDREFPEP